MRMWIAGWVIGAILGIALSPLNAVAGPSGNPDPLFGPQDFFGSLAGWGFTSGGISQPGPTITVSQFEVVTLNLFAADASTHSWLLDLNLDGGFNPGENLSGNFPPEPEVFTFVPTAPPGAYQYICGIHGVSMSGQFEILPGNAPPTVSLTNPDGVAQNRWTGGSVKRLSWTMSDPDGLPSQLAVWLNYTSSAGPGPIASPPGLPLGATFFDWTVPPINAPNVNVVIEVADPGGATGTDSNLVPIIDSTPPTVPSTVPTDNAVGVDPNAPVTITFSEAINILGPGSVTFNPSAAPLTPNWNSPGNTVLTVSHPPLLRATRYSVTVSDFLDRSNPGNPMLPFTFSFTTANDPPAIAVTQPTGISRWSGGSTHDIQWTTTDTEDPSSALTVWVNYSATGVAPFSPIVGLQGVPGDTTTFPWTVPTDDTAGARLAFSANDTKGEATTVLSPAFAIDSTAPTVIGTNPTNGQPGVPLNANMILTFSEDMHPASTEAAVTLSPAAGTLGFTWNTPNELMVTHSAAFAPFTIYTLDVSTAAHDVSDPGNGLGSVFTITFTTGAIADTTSPVLADVTATPPTTGAGGAVEISANVTDDVAVGTVSVNVTQPDLSTLNVTMSLGTGNRWGVARTWTQVGAYAFVVWASDTSGNWASAGGSFAITAIDTTPPTVTHTSPGSVEIGVSIVIHATVTDDGTVQTVRLVYTPIGGSEQNVTMTASGNDYTFTIPAQSAVGIVRYRIYAVDAGGNAVLTQEYTVTVVAVTPPPPPNVALYVGIAILVLLVVAAIAYLVIRQKRKGGDEGISPPPSGN